MRKVLVDMIDSATKMNTTVSACAYTTVQLHLASASLRVHLIFHQISMNRAWMCLPANCKQATEEFEMEEHIKQIINLPSGISCQLPSFSLNTLLVDIR